MLEEDSKLSDLYIKGEILNFTNHYRSGHFYFSLIDDKSAIKAVMFRSHASALPFMPEDGMRVLVRASLSVYERDGIYQLYITDIQPDGAGAQAIAFEQVKARLAAEGLFDGRYKKPLPAFPEKIGVVTSETGAAIQDIINVISRRYPLVRLMLCPSPVQGRDAEAGLIRGIAALDGKCDVIIVARGGGNAGDLWCFNGEALARAVFMAETPIISAVGHETDYTICDFAADLRAPTPSAAAEIAVPSADELAGRIGGYGDSIRKSALNLIDRRGHTLKTLSVHPALLEPALLVRKKEEKIDYLYKKLYNNKIKLIIDCNDRLAKRAALLDSLSPLRVLGRGYSAVFRGKSPVQSVRDLKSGDIITIRFHDGEAQATITQ